MDPRGLVNLKSQEELIRAERIQKETIKGGNQCNDSYDEACNVYLCRRFLGRPGFLVYCGEFPLVAFIAHDSTHTRILKIATLC